MFNITEMLHGIPTGDIMEQLPDHVEDFVGFLLPLKEKPTFREAAFSRKGLELAGFKTFVPNIVTLPEDLRHEVAAYCEQILKELKYGLYDGETDSFIDASDLLEGIIGAPSKVYLRPHNSLKEK